MSSLRRLKVSIKTLRPLTYWPPHRAQDPATAAPRPRGEGRARAQSKAAEGHFERPGGLLSLLDQ